MGALLSYVWGGGEPEDPNFDVPDPKTGLSPRERKLVATTWKLVQQDIRGNGIVLFELFFTDFPEYQKLFKSFENVPIKDLGKSNKVVAHANNVMYAVTSIVDNLENPDIVVEMIKKLGQNHGRRQITLKHFENLKAVIIKLLKQQLGSKFTPQAEEAWGKTLDVLNKVVSLGIEEEKKSHSYYLEQ